MRLVGKRLLREFQKRHLDVRPWITAWTAEVEAADWKRPQDIKERYASASMISKNVIIFNVKGNHYRLEVHVSYETGVVVVNRCGTHDDYARWTY